MSQRVKPATKQEIDDHFNQFRSDANVRKLHSRVHKTEMDFERMLCRMVDADSDENDHTHHHKIDSDDETIAMEKAMMKLYLF